MINKNSVGDPLVVPEEFNRHFQSVVTRNNSCCPDLTVGGDVDSLEGFIVRNEGVLKLLLGFHVRKSPDPEEIPNAYLRRYAPWVSKYGCTSRVENRRHRSNTENRGSMYYCKSQAHFMVISCWQGNGTYRSSTHNKRCRKAWYLTAETTWIPQGLLNNYTVNRNRAWYLFCS